jgi:adenosylcobinamide-GDP ribazoletransferase
VSGFRTAWIFLTRVPAGDDPRPDAGRAVPWFPIVGLVIGGLGAAVWAGARELVGPLPAAAVAIAATALVTGAFHHDGLADMADGFGGGWNPEQRLVIMKDSRHGTYGVMALVCIVIVQVSALASHGAAQGAAALVAAHALGRAGAITLLATAPPSRAAGLGSGVSSGARRGPIAIAVLVAIVASVAIVGLAGLVSAATTAVAVAACAALSMRKIGGVTGDVLGAAEQLGETAVLLTTAAFAQHAAGAPWLFW